MIQILAPQPLNCFLTQEKSFNLFKLQFLHHKNNDELWRNKSKIILIIPNKFKCLINDIYYYTIWIEISSLINKIYHKHFPPCIDFKGKMKSLWPYHSIRVLCKIRIRTVSKYLIVLKWVNLCKMLRMVHAPAKLRKN